MARDPPSHSSIVMPLLLPVLIQSPVTELMGVLGVDALDGRGLATFDAQSGRFVSSFSAHYLVNQTWYGAN